MKHLIGQHLLSSANKKKHEGNMESEVSKYAVESIVHGIQKEYGNYNMSFLMPE